jgi:hypothetical protein
MTPRLISRRYGKTGHGYTLDGEKVPGVTTILNALPKELKQWAADCAANHAVEFWDELAQLPVTKRLDRIRYAHKDVVGAAALRGTEIHKLGEKLAHGIAVAVPDEHRGPVEGYARFLDEWDIEPIASEYPVAHTTRRYGGTADLRARIGRLGGVDALIDLKSGKNIYAEVPLQLVGYRNADLWQPDGKDSEAPHTPPDAVFVAHIMPDTTRLLPVGIDGVQLTTAQWDLQFRQFLYIQQTYLWLERHGFRGDQPLIGDALNPGDYQPIEDLSPEWTT